MTPQVFSSLTNSKVRQSWDLWLKSLVARVSLENSGCLAKLEESYFLVGVVKSHHQSIFVSCLCSVQSFINLTFKKQNFIFCHHCRIFK